MSTIIWLTGQPGSGKTTLANALMRHFEQQGVSAVVFEGAGLRKISFNCDYSEKGRRKNVDYAQRLASTAIVPIVIVVEVSPYLDQREFFKQSHPGVIECYVHRKSSNGSHRSVESYEPPTENFVDVDGDQMSPPECLQRILNAVHVHRREFSYYEQ